MQNSIVTLISPKSFSELISAIPKYENAVLFAGGTYLMRQDDYYPATNTDAYISLAGIPELHKVMHSDRYIEVGSMVTLQQLLNSGFNVFSKSLIDAIENIGTSILRNQITIGGSLCTHNFRYAMSCILCTLKAQVEMRFISESGIFKKLKVKSCWVGIDKLYDESGTYIYPNNAVLTRVRIPVNLNNIQHFSTIGSPLHSPSSSVIMALQYSINQETVSSPSFCLSFINNGLFLSSEFDSILKSLKFPLSTDAIRRTSTELEKLIKIKCPNATEIQVERARRNFIATLYNANSEFLGS